MIENEKEKERGTKEAIEVKTEIENEIGKGKEIESGRGNALLKDPGVERDHGNEVNGVVPEENRDEIVVVKLTEKGRGNVIVNVKKSLIERETENEIMKERGIVKEIEKKREIEKETERKKGKETENGKE